MFSKSQESAAFMVNDRPPPGNRLPAVRDKFVGDCVTVSTIGEGQQPQVPIFAPGFCKGQAAFFRRRRGLFMFAHTLPSIFWCPLFARFLLRNRDDSCSFEKDSPGDARFILQD